MSVTRIIARALLLSLVALPCLAGVSPQEAAKLKTTLTPMGAERAGNKDGTIPAWTGKYPSLPAGHKAGEIPGNLYPKEKPLFTITAKNMNQYADKLTEGTKAWLKRHPDTFRLEVYPTHRDAVMPEYLYEATFKNATRGHLSDDGLNIQGAIGGVPFPIPQRGAEAIWNHETVWAGVSSDNFCGRSYIVSAAGKKLLTSDIDSSTDFPWNYKGMTEAKFKKDYRAFFEEAFVYFNGPPANVGEMILTKEPANYSMGDREIYSYLVGQRRVRRAPQFQYDAPNPMDSGYGNNDEAIMFYGKMDKYNWKLLGKKEIYIPYDNNVMMRTKDDELIQGHQLNPDKIRWELHRVWILDATLKPRKRHVEPHRVLYLDEDTWKAEAADIYDAQGRLWKVGLMYPYFDPRVPGIIQGSHTYFNLQTGGWLLDQHQSADCGKQIIYHTGPGHPNSFYTPDAMAARGLR